jgi:hypothetical protein
MFTDPVNFSEQAALFHDDGSVALIPRQPREVTSCVTALNDSDTAVVFSYTSSGVIWVLYSKHHSTRLDFDPTIANPVLTEMNNQGIICGMTNRRGFRFDPRTQRATLLNPLKEPYVWAVGVNNRGDVLGWSKLSAVYERQIPLPPASAVTQLTESTINQVLLEYGYLHPTPVAEDGTDAQYIEH